MAKIIDLEGLQKKKRDLDKADKLEALRSVLHCSQCAMRCARCGSQADETKPVIRSGLSFRLCHNCLDEYQDLLVYLEGDLKSDRPFWYNREWVRLWLAWLDYQQAMVNYISSPEILSIFEDISCE